MMPAGFITVVWFQARLVLKKTFLSARIIYTLGASTRYRQKLVPMQISPSGNYTVISPSGNYTVLSYRAHGKRQLHADD